MLCNYYCFLGCVILELYRSSVLPKASAEAEPKASASVRFGGRRYSAELRPKLRYYSVAIYCKIYLSFSAKMRRRRLVPSFVIFIIYAFMVFNYSLFNIHQFPERLFYVNNFVDATGIHRTDNCNFYKKTKYDLSAANKFSSNCLIILLHFV